MEDADVASWGEFLKAGAPGLKCWDASDSDLDGGSDDGLEHPPEARPPPHMGCPQIAEKKSLKILRDYRRGGKAGTPREGL